MDGISSHYSAGCQHPVGFHQYPAFWGLPVSSAPVAEQYRQYTSVGTVEIFR